MNQSGIETLVSMIKSLKKINQIAAETHSEPTSLKVKSEQGKLLKWEEQQLLTQQHMFTTSDKQFLHLSTMKVDRDSTAMASWRRKGDCWTQPCVSLRIGIQSQFSLSKTYKLVVSGSLGKK